MTKIKLNLVDGKRVAIIKSNTHTYNIRYIKSGKFAEVYKRFVKTIYVDSKSKKKSKPKPNNNGQLNINF